MSFIVYYSLFYSLIRAVEEKLMLMWLVGFCVVLVTQERHCDTGLSLWSTVYADKQMGKQNLHIKSTACSGSYTTNTNIQNWS